MSQLKPEELNSAIFCFDEIQEELNYEKARESLRQLVKKVDLTSAEISGLESQVDRLAAMLDKLEDSVIEIAAFGMVGTFFTVANLKPWGRPRIYDIRITDDKHVMAIDLDDNSLSESEIKSIVQSSGASEVNNKTFE